MKLNAELEEILGDHGWSIYYCDDNLVEIENHSPAGEDLVIDLNVNHFVSELQNYYEDFDVEEQVAMWLNAKRSGRSGIPYVRTLVDDAEAIEKMLEELAIAVTQYERSK